MSPALARRARAGAVALGRHLPSPVTPLAKSPAGSGLKPVLGDHGPPVVGYSLDAMDDLLELARRRYARFGPLSWLGVFGTRGVFVLGPDAIGEVLTNRDKAFANEPGWGYFIGPFFRRGVMLMDFEEHHHHRRIMQQAFKRERLVAYLDAMNPAIEHGLAGWTPGNGFPLYPRAKRLTLDIATQVFLGARLGAEADRLNEAFQDTVAAGMSVIRTDVPGGRWHCGLQGRRVLEEYFRAQLPAKRAGGREDLFTVLCRAEDEDGRRFSDDDIVNQMIFLLMAAHDTSTTTLTMIGYLLAKHPEWQQRLREESQALGEPQLTVDDLEQLTGMDMVMKETLRMYAPVGLLARDAIADTTILDHHIPAGTKLFLGLYPSQRMEPWWQDPDRFDPERFSDERREDQSHKYAWTPFGGSVHKCIGMHFAGMEVKAILHQLLLNNTWTVPAGYQPPIDYATGPIPADGLPIELQRL